MTTISIIGVSRGIGLATAKEALERGWSVRGLARNPAAGALEGADITLLSGDARDGGRMAELLHGADAAVSALGIEKARGRVTLFSQSTKALIAAMQSSRVRRLIAVTGLGTGDSRGSRSFWYDRVYFPLKYGNVYADKDREERLIKASNLDWTIVRPPTLTNGRRTGRYETIPHGHYRDGKIARADVAHFICECIATGAHIGELPEIAAPR